MGRFKALCDWVSGEGRETDRWGAVSEYMIGSVSDSQRVEVREGGKRNGGRSLDKIDPCTYLTETEAEQALQGVRKIISHLSSVKCMKIINMRVALFLHLYPTFSLIRVSIRSGKSDINMSSFCRLILDQTDPTLLVSVLSGYHCATLFTSYRTFALGFSIGDRSWQLPGNLSFSQNAGKFDLHQS